MSNDLSPLPLMTLDAMPYWQGARDERLMIQQCSTCGQHQFYPRDVCSACGSEEVEFVQAAGRAVVYSLTVCHRPLTERFKPGPYVVALVDLEEGPRMMTNIVGCPVEDVHIGMAVTVTFQHLTDEITLPMFAPDGAA